MTKEEPKPTEEKRCELVASILRVLNERKVRATYSAVACILGVIPQGVGRCLGERRPKASWVVRKSGKGKGKPTGYPKSKWHPDLCMDPHIITTCTELREFLGWPPGKHGAGCKAAGN